jgi:glucose-1-phosphate adenylyltransferase
LFAAQQTPGNQKWFQGTADAVRRNLEEILATPGDLVLILSGDHMYKMTTARCSPTTSRPAPG